MSSYISNWTSKASTKLCATAIAVNFIGRDYNFFYFDQHGWCQSFCNIVFKVAGVNALQALLTNSSAKDTYDWYDARGRIYSTPSVGDIVYFKWSGSSHDVDHAAIVTVVNTSTITIYEGNFGNATERQYVSQRSVSRTSSEILGYGRPKW